MGAAGDGAALPAVINEADANARCAYEQFFFGQIASPHTCEAYQRAVRRFLEYVTSWGWPWGG